MNQIIFIIFKSFRRKWNNLKLKYKNELILDLAGCLPLAPPKRFLEVVKIIETKKQLYDRSSDKKLEKFINYLKNYWYKRRTMLCVGHLPHRTNNLNESLNHRLGVKLGGKNPGIWKFLCT